MPLRFQPRVHLSIARAELALFALLGAGLAAGCGPKQSSGEMDVGDVGDVGDDEDSTTDQTSSTNDNGDDTNDDASDTGDGDDGGFVVLPDGGAVNTCDPALQDCPEGEKCTAYVVMGGCCVDANKCVPVLGNGQVGDPCERSADNDDCDAGLFCMTMSSGSTGPGVCLALCDVGTQDCENDGLPDATCIAFNDGTLPLCQDDCDPITQDCSDPLGCYGVGTQGFVCSLPGFEEGLGNDGDMCYTVQSCRPGLGCTSSEVLDGCDASRCCSPYCDLDEPDPCAAPEACVPYFEDGMAPPGSENVGLCAIPS